MTFTSSECFEDLDRKHHQVVLPQGALGEGSPALCKDQVGEDRAQKEIWKEEVFGK